MSTKDLAGIAGSVAQTAGDVAQTASGSVKEPVRALSVLEQAQLEAVQLDIENKKLERLEKQANIQDLQERLAERQMKRDDRFQKSRTNGDTIRIEKANKISIQARCNHRKGGNGQMAYVNGQGESSQYAVIKHKVCNGDVWIRCQRCGKNWKPPIEADFKLKEEYLDARADYMQALNFPTFNIMSTSYTFQFSDGGKYFREMMRPVEI